MIDIDDADVCMFAPGGVPVVYLPQGYVSPNRCNCTNQLTSPVDHNSLYLASNPSWDTSPEEMRKEECRRICWSALNLVASYTAQCAAFHEEPLELYLTEPSNVSTTSPL